MTNSRMTNRIDFVIWIERKKLTLRRVQSETNTGSMLFWATSRTIRLAS